MIPSPQSSVVGSQSNIVILGLAPGIQYVEVINPFLARFPVRAGNDR